MIEVRCDLCDRPKADDPLSHVFARCASRGSNDCLELTAKRIAQLVANAPSDEQILAARKKGIEAMREGVVNILNAAAMRAQEKGGPFSMPARETFLQCARVVRDDVSVK